VADMTKSMAQTVYPASRRNYTISAQIGSDNLNKGANGQVGIHRWKASGADHRTPRQCQCRTFRGRGLPA